MQYAKILGTGSYLPANRVSNDDLAKKVDTSDEWITTRTGIKFRHIADEHEKTSDLAVAAARRALQDAGVAADEIDLIIVATSTPDMIFPSTATIVQQKLGIGSTGCPAFDVQAVCAGFMYALTTANAYIKSGMAEKVLVIGAETFSRIMNWEDRTTCVLFGDGAGAVVLGASDEPGIIHSKLQADGNYIDLLKTPGQVMNGQVCGTPFLTMDGPGVFKFAVKMLAKVADDVIKEAGYTPQQIDWLVPHQANKRIIDSTAKHLGLSMDKVILTVQEHGNTSAASIPLALDHGIRNGQIRRGQHLLLEGIGGGFAWGAVLLKY
ncbi:beta-ketoacyl-ACP synthase III [Neisseria sp. 74A18]|uniref:beta-ketoacyl-ACP synthase III n=1 Tax=Neisseria sp. 74A18 TaxID=1696094 RepID=UPI0006CAE16E|nr:beta-ketoacyl-ACP synthase III [Neisseria sp. 74A18]KPN73264.1 3-oxoacyl-ACP synthase [Neisseria sp. 74A18]